MVEDEGRDPMKSDSTGNNGKTVLICEDDPLVRRVATLALESENYRVLTAQDGRDALEVAESETGRIDLLITDVVMPKMNGRDLADALRRKFPGLEVLFMSGYTAEVTNVVSIRRDDGHFVQKPFTPTAICKQVNQILGGDDAVPAPPKGTGAAG